MRTQVFEKSIELPVTREDLWNWHAREGAFERMTPSWMRLIPGDMPGSLESGAEANFRIVMGPLRIRWRARIVKVEVGRCFVDTQVAGPFLEWRHEHRMESVGEKSRLIDHVRYALPMGLDRIGIARKAAGRELERLFGFRHRRLEEDMRRWGGQLPGKGKTVLLTGAGGFIGSRLVPFLQTLGFSVRQLSRGRGGEGVYLWNPAEGSLDAEALSGVDAVIHLAGENIAGGLWTTKRRRRILESRVQGTRTLVEALAGLKERPEVFISASGVNYYSSGLGKQDENSPPGNGFLAEVCRRWEGEASRAAELGIRTVQVRTGVVLDPAGGALARLLPVFKAGLGGPVGTGRQGFPWIAMDDLLDVYVAALTDSSLEGPVNAVHPELASNGDFSRCLASVLRRPAYIRVPSVVVKALLGQMGEETLLSDLWIKPEKLARTGHRFRFSSLEAALGFMTGRDTSL